MVFPDKNEDLETIVKDLMQDLIDPNPKIRERAARKFNDKSRAFCFEMDGTPTYKDRIEKFNELTREIAMDSIINGLNDPNRLVRVFLIWCLGNTNDSRAIDPLIRALNDKDSGVRGASAINLFNMKDMSFQPLIMGLNNENVNI